MRPVRAAVLVCSALAAAGAAHAWRNSRLLAHLSGAPGTSVSGRVSVLIPARDEAATIGTLLADLRAQRGVADLEILVLDDDSGDGTVDVAHAAAAGDARVRILPGTGAPPPGWLGKPYACARLAAAATGDDLVFVDADVRLAPDAVAAAVAARRATGAGLLSAWPRQRAVTVLAHLVQPLQQWSWLTTLPLGLARRSRRPTLAAANGQFLALDRRAYTAAGGHGAVAGAVLEDIALARAVRGAGWGSDIVDAAAVAECLMYPDDAALIAGYGKSLWAAFGTPARSLAATGALAVVATLPPAYALAGRHGPTRLVAAAGSAAAVANRVVTARATGSPPWPWAATHPAAAWVLVALTARSVREYRRGRLTWRGRPVTAS